MSIKVGRYSISLGTLDTTSAVVDKALLKLFTKDRYATRKYVFIDLEGLTAGGEYPLTSLTKTLKGIAIDDIPIDVEPFGHISRREMELLWSLVNSVTPKELTKLRPNTFESPSSTSERVKTLKSNIEASRESTKKAVLQYTLQTNDVLDLPSATTTDIVTDITTTRFVFTQRQNVSELFDRLYLTQDDPLAILRPEDVAKEDEIYKVHDSIAFDDIYPKPFLDSDVGDYTSPFAVFTLSGYRCTLTPTHCDMDRSYHDTTDSLKDRLEELFGLTIDRAYQISIKASFEVETADVNLNVFSDLITVNKAISFFSYLNEFNKLEPLKNRYIVNFLPRPSRQERSGNTIYFTVLSSIEKRGEVVEIRVSNASSMRELEVGREFMARLFGAYNEQAKKLVDLYTALLKGSVTRREITSKVLKIRKLQSSQSLKKKQGARLTKLKERQPYIFREGYAKLCQPKRRQPYILPDDKVEEFTEKHGYNKVVDMVDDSTGKTVHYACEPREENEANDYIFAGFRVNVSDDVQYREEVPIVPCCFLSDQYTKKTSILNTQTDVVIEPNFSLESSQKTMGYIPKPAKSVPRGRYGELPSNVLALARASGYTGKKILLFRAGIMETPLSFLHCMERAFNDKYTSLMEDERIELISTIQTEIADNKAAYPLASQQLYDYTTKGIRKLLSDTESFYDPRLVLPLVEARYDCEIYVFEISEIYPNGRIVLGRYNIQGSLLPRPVNENKRSVIVVMNAVKGKAYPYQCSVVVKKQGTRMLFESVFNKDPFVREVKKLYSMHLESRIVTPVYMKHITSVSAIGNPKAQYIDSMGKTRALFYARNVTLFVSPMAPFDLKRRTVVKECKLKDALALARRLKFKVLTQEVKDGLTIGIWLEPEDKRKVWYSYIPVSPTAPLGTKRYPMTSPFLHDPLRIKGKSRLQEYRNNREIARLLKLWTIRVYTADPSSFSLDDSFTVVEDYPPLDVLMEIYDSSDTSVTVPSIEAARRLVTMIKSMILNGSRILRQTDGERYTKGYTQPSDFQTRKDSVLLRGYKQLEMWLSQVVSTDQRWIVQFDPIEETVLPYILHHPLVSKRPVLVQNVRKGELASAVEVSRKWIDTKVNVGWYTPTDRPSAGSDRPTAGNEEGGPDTSNAVIFSLTEEPQTKGKVTAKTPSVLRYESGAYAAILKL